MSKNSKKQKRKEEARRYGEIRRRIEAHQNRIGAKVLDKREAKQIAEDIQDDVNSNDDVSGVDVEDKRVSVSDDEVSYLWVYEPADLDDMSVEQVLEVWNNREKLCGSKESAAEAFALIEVAEGVVDSYQGWQGYIDRAEIGELKVPFLSDDSEESYFRLIDEKALSRDRVLKLSDDGLKAAWQNRPDSFASVEAACQALALLRKRSGVVAADAWQALMSHPEIENIKDYLPSEAGSDNVFKDGKLENKNSLEIDLRRRVSVKRVVREGQRDFRTSVVDNYYGSCCITRSAVKEVLEAAHISPYSGSHSNRLENSLCLRVDIHRLFDNFLLIIDPETSVVRLGDIVKSDCYYKKFEGVSVVKGQVQASKYLLSQHFRTFIKRHGGSV